MNEEIKKFLGRLEGEISKTPTGELRNILANANILINYLTQPSMLNCTDLEPEFVNALNVIINLKRKGK